MPTTYHIPLKSLQPIHMKIIELYLKCWKKKDIAEEVGVSCTTVSHTLRDPSHGIRNRSLGKWGRGFVAQVEANACDKAQDWHGQLVD